MIYFGCEDLEICGWKHIRTWFLILLDGSFLFIYLVMWYVLEKQWTILEEFGYASWYTMEAYEESNPF